MNQSNPTSELYTALLPSQLYRAEDVRELDRITIETFHTPGLTLMERAGEAAFELLRARWPEANNIAVVCGSGNNGGDGFVVARLALAAGLSVTVTLLAPFDKLRGDALTVAELYRKFGGVVETYEGSLPDADLLVDGVLGTGLERDVQGRWYDLLQDMNQSRAPVLALDIPSGLHSDSGTPMGICVKADATISFIGLKQGCLTAEAPEICGELLFSDLDIPPDAYAQCPASAIRFSWFDSALQLPPRSRIAHKGDAGHALVVGGELGMAGAIRLAGESAARSGAGLVTVATRSEHAATICASRPELMCRGVDRAEQLVPLIEAASVLALGPGLGQKEWGMGLLRRVLECKNRPVVLDADALNLLALEPARYDHWVLTPHPGEAARLLGCSTREVQQDRFSAVRMLQERYGGVAVLKGPGTLVYDGVHPVGVCSDGNPGMASGGMGDVLTGIIAGLLAQGLALREAAIAGVALHAASADLVAESGERGMLASDLFQPLHHLVNAAPVSAEQDGTI